MRLRGNPKPSYSPGERIFYECKPGYSYSYYFTLSSFCEKNNTWLPIDEACYRKQCPVPKIENGEVYEEVDPPLGFSFDRDAYFYCNYGYYLVGEPIITCKLNGDKVYWNHDIPKCEKILCKAPGKIKNGKFTNSWRDVFEFNEGVTYSCDPSHGPQEYSLVGENRLTCSGPGKWSSDPPECKVVQCEQPDLKNGKPLSEMKEKFFYKEEVLFECVEGFYLNGSNPVFCGGNSTWEPEMPTCIKGFKTTRPSVLNYPGYPKPRESPTIEEIVELDPGIIAVIILTVLVALAVVCTCVYKCLRREKKV
ncbi:PREDICTED: membrane cofactor protein-like [Miniopterus natalensis]|uniref:membrane cofactor protein-like n=1 Tax=Miniopterus natalensis TaxID=291302 RepID=UPI0007A6C301|nr:PREDICTED: membrane cofactor protein-like [Miniopterus natalensis]